MPDSVLKESAATGEVAQKLTNEAALYRQAAATKAPFDGILSRAAKDAGGTSITVPLKGRDRSREKVQGKYKGDWSAIKDLVRGSVGVAREDEIGKAVAAIQAQARAAGWRVGKVENRYAKERGSSVHKGPTASGYRDVSLNLISPGGHVTELQVNTHAMLEAKDPAHAIYELTRAIEERGTPAHEAAAVKRGHASMRALFERAYLKGRQGR